MLKDGWQTEVLDFWFSELTPEQWYKKDDAVDRTIVERFGALHHDVAATDNAVLSATRETALAAIIVLDQFARNMFRGSPKSFSGDAKARALANAALSSGFDEPMSNQEKQFLYMPFMHSETLADQDRAVALFEKLGNENSLKFAHLHRDPIAAFGQFPHRNAVLGRPTSPAEAAWIEEHGGF
ncbi:DUF924 family protein [Oricola sp.]|uniref:DUF924 family protein n=1 Tax=Oricola sp. TaxID=1979950 RepID=UPI0025FA3F4C|nr:DUF924 family protein [Oricola sp.]MCI5077754.1 DUF924 domain-containing protein [Oricola sp.]